MWTFVRIFRTNGENSAEIIPTDLMQVMLP
jgi:hypothetical protein